MEMDNKPTTNPPNETADTTKQTFPSQPQVDNQMPKPSSTRQPGVVVIAIVVLILFALAGGIGYYLFFGRNNVVTTRNDATDKSTTKSSPMIFQTISLSDTNLGDSATSLYFSDANKVYKAQLDGSQPQEAVSLPHNVATMAMLTNGTLLINTDNSKYEKVINKQPGDPDYKQTVVGYGYWILAPNSTKAEELDEQKYQALTRLKDNTRVERIYTKELSNGQADIMLDKFDGTSPTKIGLLKEKPLRVQVCEVGDNCLEMKYPGEFYPSFNGTYLLNKPPGGGGLGEPGVVVSRDGSKVYKIDFYWYVSSAIWIGDNRLLTKGQDGKQKIVTFKEDRTFSESPLQQDLGGYFSQDTLSSSGKLLFVSDGVKQNSIYDLEQNRSIPVENLNEAQVRQKYNLLAEEIIEQRYYFLGWNKNSDKVLYADTTGAISSAHNNDRTIEQKIKVFDVKTGKVSIVAILNPLPKNPDEYLLTGKPTANINHFAIK